MLIQRIITALVLLALLLPALLASSPWPFALLTLALIGAGGWEWARLNGIQGWRAWGTGAVVVGLCALGAWAGWSVRAPAAVWWAATVCWVVGGALGLRSGPQAWPHLPRGARWVIGVLVLPAAWLAFCNARGLGLNFLLSALCLVWMSDIAAYFGGKTWGRRKLAVTISPGKTWEGAWTGLIGVGLLALAWVGAEHWAGGAATSLFDRLWSGLGGLGAVLALAALVALGIMGDLLESLAKRAAGMKDSSGLLPGHGGVLDRVDALLPVLPAVMALASL
jgi:phosphatidate cytidylyltransferase